MLRLVHTADVHLGARHTDLGDQATAQRERQFGAFRATVELALAEKVDLFLIAGDLFDSNTQPRRSVERVAAELKRLADARIRTVIIPGTHDVYDRASIYRANDLTAIAGLAPADELLTVLTPEVPEIDLPVLDAVVYGRVFATKKAPTSPLAGFRAASDGRTWRIGLIHGSLLIAGRTEHDDVVFTSEEIAASGLDYLALGHWHSALEGRAGTVTYAYSGRAGAGRRRPGPGGQGLLVTLDVAADGTRTRDGRAAPGRPDHVREGRCRRRDDRRPAGSDRAPRSRARRSRPRARRPDHRGEARTSSTSTPTRSSAPLRPRFLKVRVRDRLGAGPVGDRHPAGRHDPRRVHPRHGGLIAAAEAEGRREPTPPRPATCSASADRSSPVTR